MQTKNIEAFVSNFFFFLNIISSCQAWLNMLNVEVNAEV